MANECTLMIETELPIQFVVSDSAAIPKGSILKMADPMVASVTTGDTDVIAGIAAEEKIANDGKTKIAVYRGGIFKGTAGAAGVTVGAALITDSATGAANDIVNADVNSENILGTSFETATDTQTFIFELKPFGINLA